MNAVRMVFLSFLSLIILLCGAVSAETTNVISRNNEFGGMTLEIVYSSGDKESKDTIKILGYFSNSNKVVKKEIFYTGKHAGVSGVNRSIVYSDTNGKTTQLEDFYTGKYADESGVSRAIHYFDSNGKITKLEDFLTDKHANETGVNRRVAYIDSDGITTLIELYMNDRLVKAINP